MPLLKKFHHLLSVSLFLLLIGATSTNAQSLVLTTPSTDILPKGKIGLRFTVRFKTNDEQAKKKFSAFTPRIIYGVGHNVEVGVNLAGHVQPGADTTTIVPTIKWRFYQNEKHGTAVVAGNSLHIPVRNKKYNLGNYFYLVGSKGFASTKTKLMVGSYYFTKNVVARNAARVGAQLGLEQNINKRVSFAAEWLSGRHSSGNLTTGFKVKMNKRVVGLFGYTIGNDKALQGNHYFLTSLSINLN